MANCNRQQLNITCGTDVVLHDRLIFDGETFDPNLSVGIAANLVSSLAKRRALDVQVVDDELLISVPWIEGTLPGCYGLEVTGSCNSKKWATYADSLIKYTKATRIGVSEVTVESDSYDITQEVGYRYGEGGNVDDVKVNGVSVVSGGKAIITIPGNVGAFANDKDYQTGQQVAKSIQDNLVPNAVVTVDDNTGTPSAAVTKSGNTLNFAFKNLKGNPLTFADLTSEQIELLRGKQGATGVYDQTTQDFLVTLETTMGQSQTKTMTQKAITDELIGSTLPIPLTAENAVVTDKIIDSNKWADATSNKYSYIFEVIPGRLYEWVKGELSTGYAWLQDIDITVGETPHYAGGMTGEGWWNNNSDNVQIAPNDAHYIIFRIKVLSNNYAPNFWGLKTLLRESILIADEKIEGNTKECMRPVLINTAQFPPQSMGINVGTDPHVWITMNSQNKAIYIPVNPGETYRFRGVTGRMYQYAFITDAERVSGEEVAYADGSIAKWYMGESIAVAPNDASYLYVRSKQSNADILPEIYKLGYLYNEIEQRKRSNRVNILYIGNSLTQDGVAYLPMLLREIAPDLDFNFYMWYNGGKKLSQQYEYFVNDTPCEIFSRCLGGDYWWENNNNGWAMSRILEDYTFDIVVLQEYMNYQTEIDVTAFNNCVGYIRDHYNKPFKVACLLHPPKRSDAETIYARTKAENIAILKNTDAMSVIDTGAAVMEAMKTSLDNLGDQGHLSPDGTHTQEGLPCLLQTYVHALWIFRQLALPYGVSNSNLRITTEVYDSINVPGPNLGTGVITGTDEQHTIAQLCAIKADKTGKALEMQAFSDIES